jgi:hypothetical protein
MQELRGLFPQFRVEQNYCPSGTTEGASRLEQATSW